MDKPLKMVGETKKGAGLPNQPPKEKPAFASDEVPATSGTKPPATIGAGQKILVVDDNPVVLKAFELKLQANGFTVMTTSTAGSVVSVAEKAAPELIILDINFPPSGGSDWSGYTAMQWLRRFPNLAGIPVILMSGDDSKPHKQKALTAGAVAFFQKPVQFPELLSAILRALGIQE
jgi:CheY-like chemotaxis protein